MSKHKLFFYVGAVALATIGIYGCSKVEKGFLSSNLYYIENPLVTTQGSITVSSSLMVDGSTSPMSVELTKIVDSAGNDVEALLTKTDSIQGFSGSISYLDSTLDLLNSKITTTAAKPFSINSSGGRIQLTPATQFVPTGTYTISVKATNVRGTVDLPNACQIIINGTGSPYIDYGGSYGGAFDPISGANLYGIGVEPATVTYYPSETNKIIYKFIDKDNKVYDVKAGGFTNRTGRWSMKQFDPYYPETFTDSSVEYQFPSVPNQFPIFSNPGIGGVIPRGTYGIFPAIPEAHNNSGHPVFYFVDMAFFAKGTYVVSLKFTDVSWK